MKLLHQQLLAVCVPYLVLAAAVAWMHAAYIEPRVAGRFHREKLIELKRHAESIEHTLDRAKAQLRLIAERPIFQSGDVEAVIAELQSIDPERVGPFEEICFQILEVAAYFADGTKSPCLIPQEEQAILLGEEVVSRLNPSRLTRQPILRVTVPVPNGKHKPIYAVTGELALIDLFPAVKAQPTPNVADLFFSDGFQTAVTPQNVNSYFTPGGAISPTLSAPRMLESGWPDGTIGLYGDATDAPQWSGWAGVQYAVPSTTWRIGCLVPQSHVFNDARRMRNLTLQLTIAGLVITAIAVVLKERSKAFRYSDLTEKLQIFGASNRSLRSRDRASDELGRLAEAFNHMADDVVHAESKLQKQLAEQVPAPPNLAAGERFAATVAHEFQAPLVTLQGFAAGLPAAANAGDWDRFQADVSRIQQTSRQLQATVEALLRLTKGSANRAADQPLALAQAARDAADMLHGVLATRTIELSIADDLPTVPGDPVLWRHVYQNLIDNAVRACRDVAAPRIEIGWTTDNGQTICFVRDNGHGMTPEELARLFLRSDAAPQVVPGAGLGLWLVRRIIEHHGSTVWAESDGPGTGTTVKWRVLPA